MVRISTPFVNAEYSIVPAETRSVQVSEEGFTVSITEQENGNLYPRRRPRSTPARVGLFYCLIVSPATCGFKVRKWADSNGTPRHEHLSRE